MLYNDVLEKLRQLENNKEIQNFLCEFNKEHFIPEDKIFGNPIIKEQDYFLMMKLGIPIGLTKAVDSKGNEVFEWSDIPDDEEVRWKYTPINNLKDLNKQKKYHKFLDFQVNYNFLPKEKVQHLAYCLQFANDQYFFDIDTINKMQSELIDNTPLKYDKAMEIFNRYYTIDVQDKFIIDKGVDIDRFYELSGLERKQINISNKNNDIKI